MKTLEQLGVTSTYVDDRGYVICRGVGGRRKVRLHRLVMEYYIGRKLLPTEDVHHKDGDKTNNDISNLELIEHGKHTLITNSREYKNGYKCNLTVDERERRRNWGRLVLAEANRRRFEEKRLGKEQPEPTEQQLKNRFYAKRWRANQKARAALAKASGGSEVHQ